MRPVGSNAFPCLAATLLAVTALMTACGGDDAGPVTSISLETLVQGLEQWQGERVRVEGRLVRFTDPDGASYGVIEDRKQHRIGLREIGPWEPVAGRQVVAEGTVKFDPAFGWYLSEPNVMAASP